VEKVSEEKRPQSDRIKDMDYEDLDGPRRCSMCGQYVCSDTTLIVGKHGSICTECILLCVRVLGEAQQEQYSQRVIDPPEMS
jgi:hypothetical protein